MDGAGSKSEVMTHIFPPIRCHVSLTHGSSVDGAAGQSEVMTQIFPPIRRRVSLTHGSSVDGASGLTLEAALASMQVTKMRVYVFR